MINNAYANLSKARVPTPRVDGLVLVGSGIFLLLLRRNPCSRNASAAIRAAANSQPHASAQAPPISIFTARMRHAATTLATAQDVVNKANNRVRRMCEVAMSVALL